MTCPNCAEVELRQALTVQGVSVDHCPLCRGVWLDKGEILLLTKTPKIVAEKLESALADQTPTQRISPRSGAPMVRVTYPGGPTMDYDPTSRGLWLDAGELKVILAEGQDIQFALDKNTSRSSAGADDQRGQGRRTAAGLLRLPSLLLRSAYTLLGLFALLGIALVAAAEAGLLDPRAALIAAVIAAALEFIVGPFVMDFFLRRAFAFRWVPPEELPEHLRQFVARVCAERKMRFPRFGILDDGAPQAFTYGHRPGNARIVLSRGILELLDPAELEAVVAHEIGHAVRWDMLLMCAAQLVPLVFYYLYRMFVDRATSSKKKKDTQGLLIGAAGAFLLYLISEYIVFWFSRTREYGADRFAGQATGNPSLLASALVKIGYGLAGQDRKVESEKAATRNARLEAIQALGIFDRKMACALAVASYSDVAQSLKRIDPHTTQAAMRWDLWNPWARWYELQSTHPLIANRLRYLSDQAVFMGKEPYVVFDELQPESYWDEFLVDFVIWVLPILAVLVPLAFFGMQYLQEANIWMDWRLPPALVVLGGVLLLRYRYAYQGDYFPDMSIAALLKRVKVSPVRPVPCTVTGTIIGKGVPGLIFSEDFVLKDDTGIIFLDYRQPLAIWELLFGLLRAEEYQGQQVTAAGWYRRSPVPYIELKSLRCGERAETSRVPAFNKWSAAFMILAGVILAAYSALISRVA
jgi:Zn-dependent protease with chaperone function/Zn-finger nucleic acid-binding protein